MIHPRRHKGTVRIPHRMPHGPNGHISCPLVSLRVPRLRDISVTRFTHCQSVDWVGTIDLVDAEPAANLRPALTRPALQAT